MPQWTLAVIWQNLFDSNLVTGTSDGLLAAIFGIRMPLWWCQGMFPSVMVLSLHYAPFAYILIGGIFRNMDANLEEAATIMGTPRLKIFARVTLPLVKPAVLSTVPVSYTHLARHTARAGAPYRFPQSPSESTRLAPARQARAPCPKTRP